GDGSTRLVLLHEPGRPRGEFVTVHPTGKDTAATAAAPHTPDHEGTAPTLLDGNHHSKRITLQPDSEQPVGLVGHPLDDPLRIPDTKADDPFPAKSTWKAMARLRREADALPADDPQRRVLERQIRGRQEGLRAGFTRYLGSEGGDLAAARDARNAKIAQILAKQDRLSGAPGERWQADHYRARLDMLRSQVRDLEHEMDLRALDGTFKQRMIPGQRDLEMVARLQDPQATAPGHKPWTAQENAFLERLAARTDWAALHPVQAAALVMIERKSELFAQRHRDLLTDKLTTATGGWSWAADYPRTPEAIDRLITAVENHLRTTMTVATNFHLDQALNANRQTSFGTPGESPDGAGAQTPPTTLLEVLLADGDGRFRNVWETNASQAAVQPSRRGGVEEHFGYAPVLRRTRDSRALFQDTGTDESTFAPLPQDVDLLPKYGALVSEFQQFGVAQRYGAFALHWSDDIRGRVSHTPNDSWTLGPMGARSVTSDSHPLPLLLWGDAQHVRRVFGEATAFAHDPALRREIQERAVHTNSYFETQIHGPLSWADLERVVISHEPAGTEGTVGGPPTLERAEEIRRRLEGFARDNDHTFRVELRPVDPAAERERLNALLDPAPAPAPAQAPAPAPVPVPAPVPDPAPVPAHVPAHGGDEITPADGIPDIVDTATPRPLADEVLAALTPARTRRPVVAEEVVPDGTTAPGTTVVAPTVTQP
ncbi:hypothetical protein, partial [Kitasatospora sp. NPDC085464]|uniref:hypothetical protein n=1 Tax=Kitasatospora sp. NPDC085464 TaxID=3364063 RepID=UPI0037C88F1A